MTDWKPTSVAFRFRLGEKILFRVPVRLEVRTTALAALLGRDAEAEDPTPLRDLGVDLAGRLVRSARVDERLPRISWLPDGIRYVPDAYARFYIDMQSGFGAYSARFSAKSRATIRRKVKKWTELCGGALDFREYRTSEELREYLPLAYRVSELSYQERLFESGLPRDDAFQHSVLVLAERDAIRAYLLFRDGVPVAYLHLPIDDGVIVYQFLGYDPAHAAHSPGTVLQWCALERLFGERRFRLFDFTEGEGSHKGFFSTHSVSAADVYYLRKDLRSIALVHAHAGFDAASRGAVSLLDHLGFKTRVKRFFRRIAGRRRT